VTGAALLLIAILLPAAAGWAVIIGARVSRRLAERRHAAVPPPEPLDRLGARLRRLHAELESLETTYGVPAKALRLRALRAAYADTLRGACLRLGVTPPRDGESPPLAEIYRVEAALRQAGLDVREPASG
jgi:hypothetical protein